MCGLLLIGSICNSLIREVNPELHHRDAES
jgi:hypothetical protein